MSTSAAAPAAPEPSIPDDPSPPVAPPTARVTEIDAIRGFALCGILLVNLPVLARMEWLSPSGKQYPVRWFLDLAVQYRFFPVFSFLFGVSVALFLTGAQDHSVRRPRLALLRRLVALGILGAAHQFIHPGEALLVVLGDVAAAEPGELDRLVAAAPARGVALAPSADGGTSALLRRPADVIPARFGRDSAKAHREAAAAAGVPCVELSLPSLSIDLDWVEDARAILARPGLGRRTRALLEAWCPR